MPNNRCNFGFWHAGHFRWTGFDYLGEPTPHADHARSSYFGIVDLAGFPKDRYWLYRSHWRPDETTALGPFWSDRTTEEARYVTFRPLWTRVQETERGVQAVEVVAIQPEASLARQQPRDTGAGRPRSEADCQR